MALIPPETVEQIQAANDIVEVIGAYFPLKRTGLLYRALCPFHQERTPSFTVNPQRQIFKCFGCGAGGTVIRFVMSYENLDFVSAAKKLAERAGIKLIEQEMSAEDSARYTLRRRLLALHQEAAEFFHQQLLKKPSAQVARDYLRNRGIGTDVARGWKLGYAPDSYEAFTTFAREHGFEREEIVGSGLVKLRDEEQPRGDYYDRFRDRVMFPVCNDSGEVIAFSGRVLEADAKAAKYINSPETMLFTKGAILFGLHKSKRALIDKGSAIVCEGQLDLITAFEAGVQNVIAPQGTAFTERQAHVLKRFVDEVVLCFDADAAGDKAAERSFSSLLAENLHVRVAEMPAGEDPDSLIRRGGVAAFAQRIECAKDFFDFQIDRQAERPDFGTPRGRTQAARKIAESISLISDPVLRETVMNKVTLRLEVSTEHFARLLKTPKRAKADPSSDPLEPITLEPTLRLLTVVALRDGEARAWLLARNWRDLLSGEPDPALLIKVLEARLDPDEQPSVTAFLATLEADEEAVTSGFLEERAPEHPLLIAQDCWRDLERRQIQRQMDSLQAKMRDSKAASENVQNWTKEIVDLKKRLSDIARPLSPPF